MPSQLLLADDSVTIQRVIELTFADEDVAVTAVGDGDAAIRALDSNPPDIVLADIGMPGCDGYQVAQHVHDTPALKGIPVLLLTGAFDPVDEGRLRALGCAGVLVKPFEPQMVIARVRELLEKRAQPAAARPAASDVPAGSQPPDAPGAPVESNGGRTVTPTDAAPAAPASQPSDERASSVDEYFARLDAAFATLNVPLDLPRSAHVPAPSDRGTVAAASRTPDAPAPAAARPAASAEHVATPPVTIGDAFGVLLDVEQGEPVPFFGESWQPVVTDDLVDAVARRVTERLSDRIIRDLAPDIVSRVAERLVREEVDRLKSLPR
jgi:CheY-like chemotaxis protein